MLSDGHEGTLRLAHEVFYVGGVTLYSKSTEEYLKEIASRVRVGTVNEKRKPLSALATWLRADCAVTKITKKVAGRYLAEELLTKGLSANIVKHIMSDLSAYFGWLVIRGEIDVNPWHVMTAAVKQSSRGSAPKRRPWRDDEALKMLEALKPNSLLLPLTAIGLYAGMRIDELCSLKLVNVTEEMFTVTDSKTQAGVRVVPVHPVIRPLIARLIKTATDGHLLPGLIGGGADNKRGHYIGKEFGKALRRHGIADKAVVYHGLRASFAQKLERGGVAMTTAALLLGHERDGMSYGTYSKGVDDDALVDAVKKVNYGARGRCAGEGVW